MANEKPVTFAERIRSLMLPGESQSAFAARAGIRQPTVNDWLNKDAAPRRSSLEVAGRNLGLDPAWLRAGQGLPKPYQVRGEGQSGEQMAQELAFAEYLDQVGDAVSSVESLAQELETLIADCNTRKAKYEAMLARLHRKTDATLKKVTRSKRRTA